MTVKPLSEECSFDKPVRTCDYVLCLYLLPRTTGWRSRVYGRLQVFLRSIKDQISNLPFAEDNAKAHTALVRYAENILTNVQEKHGLVPI